MKYCKSTGFSIIEATILLLLLVTLIVGVSSLSYNLMLKTTVRQYLLAEQFGVLVDAVLQVSGSGVEFSYPKVSQQINLFKQNSINRLVEKLNISPSEIDFNLQLRSVSIGGDKLILSEGVSTNLDELWKLARVDKIELYNNLSMFLSRYNLPSDHSDLYLLVELTLPTSDKNVDTGHSMLRVQQMFKLRQRWQWL